MTSNITYEHELKQAFNNKTYFVRALQKDGTLFVEVEEVKTGHKWKNQFIHGYIEEMTNKTGNFKTFDKFCKMMYSALQCSSSSSKTVDNERTSSSSTVFIDLLTYQDLEILKARKAAKAGVAPQAALNATHRTKNKRYLILTYVVEFDRVHYPLALKLDEASLDAPSASHSHPHPHRNACATETARRLLAHSSSVCSSCASSPDSKSSLTASPHPMIVNATQQPPPPQQPQSSESQSKQRQHFQSVPNLHVHDAENVNPNVPTTHSYRNNSGDEALRLQAIATENLKLKQRLRELSDGTVTAATAAAAADDDRDREDVYQRHQTADMVEVLEDEVKVLRQELEKKNLELRRMARSSKHYEHKQIGKRLDDMEDEIERLSTELLQEKTKYRRCCREFDAERLALQKELESVQAANEHHQRKCRQLKQDLAATQQTLEHVRMKASRQRLYHGQAAPAPPSSKSVRDSRSRSRKNNISAASGNGSSGRNAMRQRTSKYGVSSQYRNRTRNRGSSNHSKLNKSGYSNASASSVASASTTYRNRARSSSSSSNRYQRSSSAPRFVAGKNTSQHKRSTYTSRSRSPSVRFDPTAWARDKKQKIEHAKVMRNTFGATSRSPSPYRAGSRSVSPGQRQRSTSSKRRRKKRGQPPAQQRDSARDRSNSRKRNSFGATVSRSPRPRLDDTTSSQSSVVAKKKKKSSSSSIPLPHDESLNDLSVLNTMQKRQERILSMQHKNPRHGDDISNADQNDDDEDVDDDDDESTFNPTKEIESIDSRLNALQKFLRAAKSSQ
eukprot:CAMPEP_0202688740 /NCGR_PEP_ID=MMETSP1385-20130828/4192_1 /ASSEMBLY_ACC=CAM_ASM_000861 /TAXON_ID=933848 /ORGANISM="Elphidium margaritaceum" /LENGTH=786 /DNA_ID=CAMNT_0049343773 /DNA_START=79 /DNA_END=2439 /DNA_ORIENTATION=+